MSRILLGSLFLAILFAGTSALGFFVYGPILTKIADKRIPLLVFLWASIVSLGSIASYYGSWFLQDRRPDVSQQVQLPVFFACVFSAGLAGRARAKRLMRREK